MKPPRRQGPPWAALLALRPTTASLRLLRKLARATVQTALRRYPTLSAAASELGVTEVGLMRIARTVPSLEQAYIDCKGRRWKKVETEGTQG